MRYLTESLREFKNIRWLSFKRAFYLTVLVVILALAAGFALGFVDNILAALLGKIII